jgi:hypothetical protein
MREVTLRKEDFVKRVTENRENHRTIFDEAIAGYRNECIRELERRIDDLKAGKSIDRAIRLPVPEDHTSDYDQVLLMAELEVGDTITLANNEFAQYVMDNWGWKAEFVASSSNYTRNS